MADSLVIGIDFGEQLPLTTLVAFAYSANPESTDELNVIKTWPGGSSSTSDKVSTEVVYTDRNGSSATRASHRSRVTDYDDAFDFSAFEATLGKVQTPASSTKAGKMRWGSQIRPDEERLRCLKLFLDPAQPFPDYISLPDTYRQLRECGKNVGTVVAEYLAVWSDATKHATLKAAEAAGMGDNIAIISEPEAAAVHTLQAIQPNHLKIGHNFVVIDAGGGTVDLISYSIKQLKPLRLEQLAKGSGGFFGPVFRNLRFEDIVRAKFKPGVFDGIRATRPRAWQPALRYFEDYVKRNFDPEEDDVFNIPFPGVEDNAEAGVECGFLVMDSTEVADIFELVEGQIDSLRASSNEVNGLILVGGFGQSKYLHKRLQDRFSAGMTSSTFAPTARGPKQMKSQGGIEVLQPVNAWTVVVRGAVLRGLEGGEMVTNRKARRHYGVKFSEPYDSTRHKAPSMEWDPLEGDWIVDNRMRWSINKAQTVSSTKPVVFPFYRAFDTHGSRIVADELIVCDTDCAPGVYDGVVTYAACSMTVDLSSVPKRFWTQCRTLDGKAYQTLHYNIGMQIESGGLRFDLSVDGVVYGQAKVTFK